MNVRRCVVPRKFPSGRFENLLRSGTGKTARPIGLSSNQEMIGFQMINAATYGWGTDVTEKQHSDLKDLPFYSIFDWYGKVFDKIK